MANAPPTGFERATLEIEGGGPPIECLFNPTEYSISKTNVWKVEPVTGAALPPPQFTGGLPRELTLELLFDTSDSEDKDVREITDKLLKATEVGESGGGRPPTITFGWGQTVSFKAVARQLTVRYTLFRADGSPVRALAHMSLMQAEKAQDGSSTPGGTPRRRQPDDEGHRRDQLTRRARGRQPALDRLLRLRRPDALAHDRRGERHRRPAPAPARPLPRDPEARAVSPAVDTGVMLALVEVKIDGVPVNEDLIQEVRVQDSLAAPRLPSASLRPRELARGARSAGGRRSRSRASEPGSRSSSARPTDKQRQKLFDGEITALEPNFGPEGISPRGLRLRQVAPAAPRPQDPHVPEDDDVERSSRSSRRRRG